MNFESYIKNRKSNAFHEYKLKLKDASDLAIKHGAQGGSRMFVLFQSAISKQIEEFGSQLINFMIQNDPLHSPIKVKDFEVAKRAVNELLEIMILEYEKRGELGKAFGNTVLEVDRDYIALEQNKVLHEIELARASFKSQRSILKLAVGDMRRAFFTTLVAIFFAFIGSLAERTFSLWRIILGLVG